MAPWGVLTSEAARRRIRESIKFNRNLNAIDAGLVEFYDHDVYVDALGYMAARDSTWKPETPAPGPGIVLGLATAAKRRIKESIKSNRDLNAIDAGLVKFYDHDVYADALAYMAARDSTWKPETPAPGPGIVSGSATTARKRKAGIEESGEKENKLTIIDEYCDSEHDTPEKKITPVLSNPSRILVQRWGAIDDGEPEENVPDGSEIGRHTFLMGFMTRDVQPKRLVFASIGPLGKLEIQIHPYDKFFRHFTPTAEHEKVARTGIPYTLHWNWIRSNVKFDEKVPHQTETEVRGWVFGQMKTTPEGRERIATWVNERETQMPAARRNPRILADAKHELEEPAVDPFMAEDENVTLAHFMKTVVSLYDNEFTVRNEMISAMKNLRSVFRSLTNLKERDQAIRLCNALGVLQTEIMKQRAHRTIRYMTERVNGGEVILEAARNETKEMREQLENCGWRMADLKDDGGE